MLIKNDASPVMFPLLNPYGHVAFQAQRGDVHTVLVNGRVVKHDHRLVGIDLDRARQAVEATVEHLQSTLGPEAWAKGMNPDIPATKILDNPYTVHRLPHRLHPRAVAQPAGQPASVAWSGWPRTSMREGARRCPSRPARPTDRCRRHGSRWTWVRNPGGGSGIGGNTVPGRT